MADKRNFDVFGGLHYTLFSSDMLCSDETVFISVKEKFISISITDLIKIY
jgi:hypothetical protein